MKNRERLGDIEQAAVELEGVADQLNCIVCSLSSRNGSPSKETLENALLAMAAHINRISDDITDATTELIHANKTDKAAG